MGVRVIFMGTPVFATAVLKSLVEQNYDVVAVVTQPDKPIGRQQVLTPTPIKVLAQSLQIPVLQPLKIKESIDEIRSCCGDMVVNWGYGPLRPPHQRVKPGLGCLKVHP